MNCKRLERGPSNGRAPTPLSPARASVTVYSAPDGAELDWSWRKRAACAEAADPTVFDDPDRSRSQRFRGVPASAIGAARMFCRRCPVREQCGAEADELLDPGLRGGVYRMATLNGYTTYDLLGDSDSAEEVA